MKIWVEEKGRYLQPYERICPECEGDGRKRETTDWHMEILRKFRRPEPFDLDACNVCKGQGILKIVYCPGLGLCLEPLNEEER